jgi:Fe2+ or Zn2+ uptake regulation protein
MSEPIDQLKVTLRQNGLSLTAARRAVFEALQQPEPQTMSELVGHCSNIDRASTYRSVVLFERLGIIQRLQIGWKYKLELTDAFMRHHHHFSCVRCGHVITLPEDMVLERRLRAMARRQHFLAQDHQLEIRGLCATCRMIPIQRGKKSLKS